MTTRLEAIRQREQEATKGPWVAMLGEVYPADGEGFVWPLPGGETDAEFIAHARTDIPALLAAVEAVARLFDSVPVTDENGGCVSCRWSVGHETDCDLEHLEIALAPLLEPEG